MHIERNWAYQHAQGEAFMCQLRQICCCHFSIRLVEVTIVWTQIPAALVSNQLNSLSLSDEGSMGNSDQCFVVRMQQPHSSNVKQYMDCVGYARIRILQPGVCLSRRSACESGVWGHRLHHVLRNRADLVLRASMTGVKRSLSSAAMWEAHLRDVLTRPCDS